MAQTSLVLILLALVLGYVLFSGKISFGTTSIDTTPTGGWTYDGGGGGTSSSSGGGGESAAQTNPSGLDPNQSAPEDKPGDGNKKYSYRGRQIEGITTFLATVGVAITIGVITSKLDERILEMKKNSKVARKVLNDAIAKDGNNIIRGSGSKIALRSKEYVVAKNGQKVAAGERVLQAMGPLTKAEIAFTLFTGYMDSLDLGGFSKLSTMESLNATRDTIDEMVNEQFKEAGGTVPLIYGPFDKLTEEEYDEKLNDEFLKILAEDVKNGKIKSEADYTDAYVDKTLDKASMNLCKSLGGVSHGFNKCSFIKEDCNARWPQQIGDTYYEFRDGVCQVRGSMMRTVCEDMGLGVTYDMDTGSCKLSEAYCGRYGGSARLDGKGDCYIDKGQEIMEAVFGRTFVRSIVNIFNFKDNYEKCKDGETEANELMLLGLGPLSTQFFCSGSKCEDDEEKMMTTRGVDKQLGGLCYPSCKKAYLNKFPKDKQEDPDIKKKAESFVSYWGEDSTSRVAGMCYAPCPSGTTKLAATCYRNPDAKVNNPLGQAKCPTGSTQTIVGPGGMCEKECPTGYKRFTAGGLCMHEATKGNPTGTVSYGGCKSGYRDDGLFCTRDASCKTFWRDGTGVVTQCSSPDSYAKTPTCEDGYESKAGGCYAKTRPVEWTKPKSLLDVGECGSYDSTDKNPDGTPKWKAFKDGGLCYKPCDEAFGKSYHKTTAGMCQMDAMSIPRENFTRQDTGIAYSVTPKKRKAPFPSTSESDFKNSTMGKYIQKGINSIRDGDSKGFGVAMGGLLLVNNPVLVATGMNVDADQGNIFGTGTKGYSSLL